MAFQSLLYPENFPKVVGGYNGYWGIEPQGKMRGSNRQVASRCSRATWMGLCVLSPISHIRYVFLTILIGSSSIKDILSRCLPSTVRRGRDRNSHPARTSAVTTQIYTKCVSYSLTGRCCSKMRLSQPLTLSRTTASMSIEPCERGPKPTATGKRHSNHILEGVVGKTTNYYVLSSNFTDALK
jgi:hypothetical protein